MPVCRRVSARKPAEVNLFVTAVHPSGGGSVMTHVTPSFLFSLTVLLIVPPAATRLQFFPYSARPARVRKKTHSARWKHTARDELGNEPENEADVIEESSGVRTSARPAARASVSRSESSCRFMNVRSLAARRFNLLNFRPLVRSGHHDSP